LARTALVGGWMSAAGLRPGVSASASADLGMDVCLPGENHVHAADWRRWRLANHVPVGGVVMGHFHASSAASHLWPGPLSASASLPPPLGLPRAVGTFALATVTAIRAFDQWCGGLFPGENHVRC